MVLQIKILNYYIPFFLPQEQIVYFGFIILFSKSFPGVLISGSL